MEFQTFQEVVRMAKTETPLLFELEHDNIPTLQEVTTIQEQYQIILPEKYIQFLLNFGGGYFGYAIIYSLDQDSDFFIFNHNASKMKDLLFMADNECGDYYAFQMEGGRCSEEIVFYDHDSNTVQGTEFSDVFEYLIKMGLHQ